MIDKNNVKKFSPFGLGVDYRFWRRHIIRRNFLAQNMIFNLTEKGGRKLVMTRMVNDHIRYIHD